MPDGDGRPAGLAGGPCPPRAADGEDSVGQHADKHGDRRQARAPGAGAEARLPGAVAPLGSKAGQHGEGDPDAHSQSGPGGDAPDGQPGTAPPAKRLKTETNSRSRLAAALGNQSGAVQRGEKRPIARGEPSLR